MTREEWHKIILVAVAFLAWAIIGGLAVREQERGHNGGPFCDFSESHMDMDLCEFKVRQAYIVNNG